MNVKRCTITEILKQIDQDVTYFMPDELLIAMRRSKTIVRRLVKCRTMTLAQYDAIKESLVSKYMQDTVVTRKQEKLDVLDRVMERQRRKINKIKIKPKVESPLQKALNEFFKID